MITLDTLLKIIPWAISMLVLAGSGLLGWKIGVPGAKIAQLEQRIKLFELKLRQSDDRAKTAEALAKELSKKMDMVLRENDLLHKQVRSVLDTIELKTKLNNLADQLQPLPRAGRTRSA